MGSHFEDTPELSAPPGPDLQEPFPIDRGDAPGTPGSYKRLPLRITDNGEPTVTAVDGVIGVVCLGMSNSSLECNDFIEKLGTTFAGEVNPQVRVVNCAVGGNAIERWNDPTRDDILWDRCINRKLPGRGVRPDQVRVIYHKAANQFGSTVPSYPDPFE